MSDGPMRDVEESGFRVSVPRESSFRFDETATYRKLSGAGLKEMDLLWWDAATERLIALELKGEELWDAFDREQESAHAYLVQVVDRKVTDALLMLAAVWSGTAFGESLKEEIPERFSTYPGDKKLKFVCLIDTPPTRKPLLVAVKDAVNLRASGRVRLFGADRVTLLDADTARKMGLPITRSS